MKQSNRWMKVTGWLALCSAMILSSGCMNLSLFSSKHTHYHGGAELREQIQKLETKIDDMEKQQPTAIDTPPCRP